MTRFQNHHLEAGLAQPPAWSLGQRARFKPDHGNVLSQAAMAADDGINFQRQAPLKLNLDRLVNDTQSQVANAHIQSCIRAHRLLPCQRLKSREAKGSLTTLQVKARLQLLWVMSGLAGGGR